MQVKLNTIMAGPSGCHHPGTELELPEEQARELVRTGQATAITGQAPVVRRQAASKQPAEESRRPRTSRSSPQSTVTPETGEPPANTAATGSPAGAASGEPVAGLDTEPTIPDLPFEEFGVPGAVAKKLSAAGLETSHDLQLMRGDLTSIDGIGDSTAQMLCELLDDLAADQGTAPAAEETADDGEPA